MLPCMLPHIYPNTRPKGALMPPTAQNLLLVLPDANSAVNSHSEVKVAEAFRPSHRSCSF